MSKENDVVYTPKSFVQYTVGQNSTGFACYETQCLQDGQEDALVCLDLDKESEVIRLTPEQLGARLWSTHKQLDEETKELPRSGTTASSNLYDGKGNIITATLGDAASFAVVYRRNGQVSRVVRLNSITHKPSDPVENRRIVQQGGGVCFGRVKVNWLFPGRLVISNMQLGLTIKNMLLEQSFPA